MHYISAAGSVFHHYIKFGRVELTGAAELEVSASTAGGKASVFIHADTPNSEPIGTIQVGVTGGPAHFVTVKGELKPLNGIHDLYLVFEQGISLLNLAIHS